jgi:hypothetical protein
VVSSVLVIDHPPYVQGAGQDYYEGGGGGGGGGGGAGDGGETAPYEETQSPRVMGVPLFGGAGQSNELMEKLKRRLVHRDPPRIA